MTTTNRPAIRFAGFTDEWKENKIIDVCDYVDYRGKTPLKTSTGIFLITAKNIKMGYIDYLTSQEYVSLPDYSVTMSRGLPELGDVVITTEAPCGNVAQIDRTDVALAQRVIKYRGKKGVIDNTYLKYTLSAPNFQNILLSKATGGTVKGIKGSILHQIKIKLPIFSEQTKIGDFFQSLDATIALREQELETLKASKQGFLQKMFPKAGQSKPELRFTGFTEDWGKKKLGDVAEITSGFTGDATLLSGEYKLTRIETISNGLINENCIGYSNEKPIDKFLLRNGDILYSNINSIAHIGKVAIYQNKSLLYHGINLLRLSSIPEYIVPEYLFYQLNTRQKQIWAKSHANQAVNQASINQTALSKQTVALCGILEQQKIGEFFKQLDEAIALKEQEIEIIKQSKKAFLQKMFV